MKKIAVLFIIFCIAFISCTQNQIPFDKAKWQKGKNRFYMTDSLVEKLNEEKPKKSEIFDLLGRPELEGRIYDNTVSYWLKSEGIYGLAMWELYIFFDDNGDFKSADIVYSD